MAEDDSANAFQLKWMNCCDSPSSCLYVSCCPCLAYQDAATNMESDAGFMYCCGTLLGCHCCVLTHLAMDVAAKRNIPHHDQCMTAAAYAFCNACTCYSCRVFYESKVYKATPVGERSLNIDR